MCNERMSASGLRDNLNSALKMITVLMQQQPDGNFANFWNRTSNFCNFSIRLDKGEENERKTQQMAAEV